MDIIQDTEKGLSIQYEAFFNKASIGIILVNEQGEIILANPFLLQLFGYESEELFGKKIETLIPQRYHAQHPKDRTGYTQNPKSRPMGSGLDLFGIKKNGVEFPVEISLSSYYSETNEKFVKTNCKAHEHIWKLIRPSSQPANHSINDSVNPSSKRSENC